MCSKGFLFGAKTMLERLRNRRLAFVGDSIGRNQWESLLCLLSNKYVKKK
ncbi:putative PC-Esterase [Helianthus annuus]|nr:putative PC-Esterase [Helianthus annuus]